MVKKPFVEFESVELKVFSKGTIVNTEKDLLEVLYVGICEGMFSIDKKFWNKLYQLEKTNDSENLGMVSKVTDPFRMKDEEDH